MRFIFAAILLLTASSLANAQDAGLTCAEYGCPDCSCVADNPELRKAMAESYSVILDQLVEAGIPPESVSFSMAGYNGEELRETITLADGRTMGCCCGCGSISCKWTFEELPTQ